MSEEFKHFTIFGYICKSGVPQYLAISNRSDAKKCEWIGNENPFGVKIILIRSGGQL